MSGDNIDRRQLLKSIAASGAVAKWPALARSASAAEETQIGHKVFSPPQAMLMESLVDAIIPADDFPGAKEAGVVTFIDRKLSGAYGNFFLARYQAGLSRVDEIARERFQHNFAALDGDRQSIVLHAIEDDTYGADIHEFFQMLVSDTHAGYYGSPEDGGNRDGASWKMIGFKG